MGYLGRILSSEYHAKIGLRSGYVAPPPRSAVIWPDIHTQIISQDRSTCLPLLYLLCTSLLLSKAGLQSAPNLDPAFQDRSRIRLAQGLETHIY